MSHPYPEWDKWQLIKVNYGHPIAEIERWCNENIGKELWSFASNAHHFIFFIPNEHATMFMLRWK